MSDSPQPRELEFNSLYDSVKEAERLAKNRYTQLGEWNLTQACGHCANWLRYPVEGFPKAPLMMRLMMPVMRLFAGKRMLRDVLESGRMKPGMPTAPYSIVEPGDGNAEADAAAVEDLHAAVEQFTHHGGKLHPSPLFGEISRIDMTRLHCIHIAHHLGFLIPKETAGDD